MARRNDNQQGPGSHSRNRASTQNACILISNLIFPVICFLVICVFWGDVLQIVRSFRGTAAVPADAGKGSDFSVTGEGSSIAYPAPENGVHQHMLATAALRNSQGFCVGENSGRQPSYEHSDSILESRATGPVVNGSDLTATSELGAHRPSDLLSESHYLNMSDTASGNKNTRLQGPSLRSLPCNSSALLDVVHGSSSTATFKGSATVAAPPQPPLQPPSSETATVQAPPVHDRLIALTSRVQACTARLETANSVPEISQVLDDLLQAALDANLDLSPEERITVVGIGFKRHMETIRQLRSQQPLQPLLQPPSGVKFGETAMVHVHSGRDFAPGTSLTSADTVTANTVATTAGSLNASSANATIPMPSANKQPNARCSHGAPPVHPLQGKEGWQVVFANGAVVLPISAGVASITLIAIAAAVVRQLRHTWASRKACPAQRAPAKAHSTTELQHPTSLVVQEGAADGTHSPTPAGGQSPASSHCHSSPNCTPVANSSSAVSSSTQPANSPSPIPVRHPSLKRMLGLHPSCLHDSKATSTITTGTPASSSLPTSTSTTACRIDSGADHVPASSTCRSLSRRTALHTAHPSGPLTSTHTSVPIAPYTVGWLSTAASSTAPRPTSRLATHSTSVTGIFPSTAADPNTSQMAGPLPVCNDSHHGGSCLRSDATSAVHGSACQLEQQHQKEGLLLDDIIAELNFYFSRIDHIMFNVIFKEAAVNGRRASRPPGLQYEREQFQLDTSHLTPGEEGHLTILWTTPATTEDAQKFFCAFESKYRRDMGHLGRDGDHSGFMLGWLLQQGLVMTRTMEQWLHWKLSQLNKENDYYEQKELAAADVGGVVHTVVHTYHDANPLNMFRVATGAPAPAPAPSSASSATASLGLAHHGSAHGASSSRLPPSVLPSRVVSLTHINDAGEQRLATALQAVPTHLVPTPSFSTVYNWPPSTCHLFESGGKQQDYVNLRDLLRGHCLLVLPLAGGSTAGLPAAVVPRQGVAWPGSGGPGTLLSPALGGQRTHPGTAMAFHPHQPLLAAAGADYWAVYELYDPQADRDRAAAAAALGGRGPLGGLGHGAGGPAERAPSLAYSSS